MSSRSSILSMRKRINRISNLVLKEFDTMSKDPISVGVLFILPIVIIWVAAVAEMSPGDPITLWIIDYDNTELSKELIDSFIEAVDENNVTVFTVYDNNRFSNITEQLALKYIPTADLDAFIVLHEGFEDDIKETGNTSIDIYVDGLDFFSMLTVEGMIDSTLVNFQLGQGVFESQVFYFPVFEPELSDDILTSAAPMILTLSLWASITLICTQSVVGDIPLKRVLVSPTRRFEVIIAKTIAYGALAFFQCLTSLFLVEFFFGVKFIGIFIDIFTILFLVEMCGVTMGIFFSTISTSRLQAAQLFLFYFIMAMLIQLQLRFPFVLPFLPAEQGQGAIINIAYRGQSIFENLIAVFNLIMTYTLFFALSIYWIVFRKKEL